MPVKVTTPSAVETPVCKALVERCDSNDDLTSAVMEASSILSPTVESGAGRSLGNRHLVLDRFDIVNVLGVFGGEFLFGQAAGIALQCDDAIFRINGGSGGAHVAMEQKRGLHFHGDPGV